MSVTQNRREDMAWNVLSQCIPNEIGQGRILGLDAERGGHLVREDLDVLRELIEALRILTRGAHMYRNGLGEVRE